MIMEAEMFHDLQSASWSPNRANGIQSSVKANWVKTQEELMF